MDAGLGFGLKVQGSKFPSCSAAGRGTVSRPKSNLGIKRCPFWRKGGHKGT